VPSGRFTNTIDHANPEVPHLEGAAFDIGKKSVFEDRENKIRIELREKTGILLSCAYRASSDPLKKLTPGFCNRGFLQRPFNILDGYGWFGSQVFSPFVPSHFGSSIKMEKNLGIMK